MIAIPCRYCGSKEHDAEDCFSDKKPSRQRIRRRSGPHTLLLSLLVLLGAFGYNSHKVEADISSTCFLTESTGCFHVVGPLIYMDDTPQNAVLFGSSVTGALDLGQSADYTTPIDVSNSGTVSGSLQGQAPIYNVRQSSTNGPDILNCGDNENFVLDMENCPSPPSPPPPVTNPFYYTYASSTCSVIGNPPTSYICTATTTHAIEDRPITDNHFIIILGYLTAILSMWLIISIFKRRV